MRRAERGPGEAGQSWDGGAELCGVSPGVSGGMRGQPWGHGGDGHGGEGKGVGAPRWGGRAVP